MKRIQLISGPRNVSTALMYSFGNREDCSVVDEAFYGYYLDRHPHIIHPGRDEVLDSMRTDYQYVLDEVIFGDYPNPIVFFKNMAHHFDGADWRFLSRLTNILLIRRPDELLASFIKKIANPTMLDIGLELEYRILEHLKQSNSPFIVIDSGDLLKNPEAYLKKLCHSIDIPFSVNMLSWQPGPRQEDGIWAKYWYENVHKSRSFVKPVDKECVIPKSLNPLLDEAWRYYEALSEYKLKPE